MDMPNSEMSGTRVFSRTELNLPSNVRVAYHFGKEGAYYQAWFQSLEIGGRHATLEEAAAFARGWVDEALAEKAGRAREPGIQEAQEVLETFHVPGLPGIEIRRAQGGYAVYLGGLPAGRRAYADLASARTFAQGRAAGALVNLAREAERRAGEYKAIQEELEGGGSRIGRFMA